MDARASDFQLSAPGSKARPYKIAISLYYDGLNPCNALGPWANIHPIGAFYYSITNLDSSIRTAKPYLQLVTIVNDNLLKHYAKDIVTQLVDMSTGSGPPHL